MKVLGAAFVMLMRMQSSSAPRPRCEGRCARIRSRDLALHESPGGSPAASPSVFRNPRIQERRAYGARD
jgi:hypothetical protein